ncbi:hypothetical protein AB4Z16_28035, partial [Bosea sp. TAF32]
WRVIDTPVLDEAGPWETPRQSRSSRTELMTRPGVLACGLLCAIALNLVVVVLATREQLPPQFPLSDQALETLEPQVTVRPFVSLSSAPEGVAFAADLSEEVLTNLAKQKHLQVFAENGPVSSVAGDRGKQIAHLYIVEGSVRQSADRWRVSTRLIDARTTAVKWAYSANGELRTGSNLAAELGDLITLQLDTAAAASCASARTAGPSKPLSEVDRGGWP